MINFQKFASYLLLTITGIFIVIHLCSADSVEEIDRYKREDSSDDSLALEPVVIACSREFKKKSNALHREALCRTPRKVLVQVEMPSKYYMPGVYHRPKQYSVERCDGVCQHPNHKCLPIEEEMVEVPVTSEFIFSKLLNGNQRTTRMVPQEKCMNVKIKKHMLCSCKCVMTEQNCNGNQDFSQDRCTCECRDTSRAKTCSQINKMWDNEKCDCVCPPTASRTCSSGAVFDEEMCRCLTNA